MDLVRRQVAVIATAGDHVAPVAKAATATIPIVSIVAQDPVELGLVATLARPGGNVTAVNFFSGELSAKRLGLLRELLPGVTRVAALIDPTNRNGDPRLPWDLVRLARHRATKLGYRVHRSRRRKGPDSAGNLMLIHKASSTVLLSPGYSATVEMILKFMERERMQVGRTTRLQSSHQYMLRPAVDEGPAFA